MSTPATTSATTHHHHTTVSDSDSDSDTEATPSHHVDLSNTIFKSYFHFTSTSPQSPTPADLSKIQSFLTSSSSGALSCLICLERIKPSDPTWSCSSLCFSLFHLVCIQSWAQQSLNLASSRALTRLSVTPEKAAENSTWNCPKCRYDYSKTQVPKLYLCFCGKVENPKYDDPWVLPHSCGEVCNRPLKNSCGHCCLLLCHPGPCPSCPQLVRSKCFCGGVEDVRRCGFKDFSCGNQCKRFLDCGVHRCSEVCHEGDCPPCKEGGVYRCQCGRKVEERECCERDFRCEASCEKALRCGKHFCERGCHFGECGDCPLQGRRTCPCGKRVYEGLACDVNAPLCGATCGKMLSCGMHRCHERCHRGPCLETCRLVVVKSCRCGSLKKEVRINIVFA